MGVPIAIAIGAAPESSAPETMSSTTRWITILFLVAGIGGRLFGGPGRGAPCTRFYSYDEIGGISTGVELSFDPAGRLALVQNSSYIVLNDESWLEVLGKNPTGVQVRHTRCDPAEGTYYGSVGGWGRLVPDPQGLLVPESLVPAVRPDWTLTTEFTQIVSSSEGVCFGGWPGVVLWNRATGRTTFELVPGLAQIFLLDGQIHVSSHGRGVQLVNLREGKLSSPDQSPLAGLVVEQVAQVGPGRAILSTSARDLLRLDHGVVTHLPGALWERIGGRIAALESIPGGAVAMAVVGVGLYIISSDGEVVAFFAEPEYRDIKSLASNEPGVLWAATESGLVKILLGIPVTRFNQASGLPVFWPQFLDWRGRLLAVSNGHLYGSVDSGPGVPARFELVAGQPSPGVWGVAACGDWLLIGNGNGIFAKEGDGAFRQVVSGIEVARLVVLESGLCFAIGMNEIAVLTRDAQGWRECADRVPGFGYPAVVHASKTAAWIEVGANLAGRVSLESGAIKVRVVDSFPWQDPRWIHVSVLGGTVVLSGPESGRVFYDEEALQLRDHAPVEEVLRQYRGAWPARIAGDPQGTLWFSHAHGVGLLRREPGGYVDESNLYRVVDRYIPQIQVVPGQGVFLSTGSEIFEVEEPDRSRKEKLERFVPTIVSAVDTASGRLLFPGGGFVNGSVFPHDRNGLSFRLFAGSYAARRAPPYEVRTNGGNWERLDGSMLTLPNLRAGRYQVEIRLADKQGTLGRATRLDFSVEPPWTRTWQGYLAYGVVAIMGLGAFARWLGRRARRRNAALESLVGERTEQLQSTMRQLEEETRHSATLAERNRLAGEIHDTLEQSLSALSLQLASAARLPECTENVRAGLAIARNMVAFSKDEVRNAVMDLHSPQIEAEGIVSALTRLVGQSLPGEIQGTVKAEGTARVLGSKIEHHLLRIAQEAVANTVKHAEARHIDVHLRYLDEAVVLSIVDDGKGFDPASARLLPPGHFGLKLLRGRAAKLGGKMEIASGPQQGTRIEVHVPTNR